MRTCAMTTDVPSLASSALETPFRIFSFLPFVIQISTDKCDFQPGKPTKGCATPVNSHYSRPGDDDKYGDNAVHYDLATDVLLYQHHVADKSANFMGSLKQYSRKRKLATIDDVPLVGTQHTHVVAYEPSCKAVCSRGVEVSVCRG